MPVTPSNLGFCRVHGQLVYMDYQNLDPDGKPNLEPWANKWVKFTPLPKKVTDLTNTPRPLTIATKPTTLYTNADGVIVGDPTESNLYGWVFGGNDPDLNPSGWDYRLDFQDAFFPPAYALAPAGGDLEIASVMNTVGNEGELVGPAQAAATAAASSAASAAASAASISPGTPGGVATLGGDGKLTASQVPSGLGGGGGGLGSVVLSGTPSANQIIVASTSTAAAWATGTKALVGLGNVDNTSDANKPVSTAQAAINTSLDGRLDTLEPTVSAHSASISDLNGAMSTLGTQVTGLDTDLTTLEGVVAGITAPGGATLTDFGQIKLAGDLAGVGGTAAVPKVLGLDEAKADILTLETALAAALEAIEGLTTRITTLESFGANAVIIAGQTSPRVNPITGGALHDDSVVIWKSPAAPPTNAVEGDIPLNRAIV